MIIAVRPSAIETKPTIIINVRCRIGMKSSEIEARNENSAKRFILSEELVCGGAALFGVVF